MNYAYFLIKQKKFLTTSLGVWYTHTSHNIHVREILMLNSIYHYDEVRGEIKPLYVSWLFYTFNYIFIEFQLKNKTQTFFLN
jgi:hypothetical protein